jgi:hypothetical protein
MRNLLLRVPDFERETKFLSEVCCDLFSCDDKYEYLADIHPRYASGYRPAAEKIPREFWHYSESDLVVRWPNNLTNKLAELNCVLSKAKLQMLAFLRDRIQSESHRGEMESDPAEYLTRVRFIHYLPSRHTRFESHIDSGAATLFMFESSPGLRIDDIHAGWRALNKDDFPALIVSGGTEEACGIPSVAHEVTHGDQERLACAIFLHGYKQPIGKLLGAR